jgi:hypothetical protein
VPTVEAGIREVVKDSELCADAPVADRNVSNKIAAEANSIRSTAKLDMEMLSELRKVMVVQAHVSIEHMFRREVLPIATERALSDSREFMTAGRGATQGRKLSREIACAA